MRKSDKKIENKLRKALTTVCDHALLHCEGYLWISHQVNYQQFPQSLRITCMFSSSELARQADEDQHLSKLIMAQLKAIEIQLKQPQKQISFKHEH